MLYRLHRIWTELSHDVLNPAHVPLSWANSPTLGTYYRPRLRRADIEVPNLPVDVNSWGRSACSNVLLQRCLNPCFSKFPGSSDYVINLKFIFFISFAFQKGFCTACKEGDSVLSNPQISHRIYQI